MLKLPPLCCLCSADYRGVGYNPPPPSPPPPRCAQGLLALCVACFPSNAQNAEAAVMLTANRFLCPPPAVQPSLAAASQAQPATAIAAQGPRPGRRPGH